MKPITHESLAKAARAIPYRFIAGAMYLLIALSILLSPRSGALGWWREVMHADTGPLCYLFFICAVILFIRPSRALYVGAVLLPLLCYLFATLVFTISVGSISAVTATCFLSFLMNLMIISEINRSLTRLVLSIGSMLIGAALIYAPHVGALGWLAQHWGWDSVGVYVGATLVLSGIWTGFRPAKTNLGFLIRALPLLFYLQVVFRYSVVNEAGGLVGIALSILFIVTVLYAHLHFEPYIEIPRYV